jgi:hypothetical protein
MVCILGNTALTFGQHFGQSMGYAAAVGQFSVFCTIAFTAEAILRVAGVGWATYARNGWNRFDFAIVLASYVGIVLQAGFGIRSGSTMTLLRVARVFRVIRASSGFHGLKKLINAMMMTLPSLGNITGLLLLMYSIFAVMAVQLFAKVRLDGPANGLLNYQVRFF